MAVALIFSTVAIAVSADTGASNVFVVSAVDNVGVGTTQEIKVYVQKGQKAEDVDVVLTFPKTTVESVSIASKDGLNTSKEFTATVDGDNHKISAVVNCDNSAGTAMKLAFSFKIKFKSVGLVEITASAKKGESTFGVIGELDSTKNLLTAVGDKVAVNSTYCGAGLKGYITKDDNSTIVTSTIKLSFKYFDGSTLTGKTISVDPIAVTDAIHNKPIKTAAEIKELIAANADAITNAIRETGVEDITYNDFEVLTSSIKFGEKALSSSLKYSKDGNNDYTVTLSQLKKTKATVNFVFASAFNDKTLYHSSDIPALESALTLNVHVGTTVDTKSIVTAIKDAIELYNKFGSTLPDGNLGQLIDNHIQTKNANVDGDQLDINDFELNETTFAFNGTKMDGKETYNANVADNVITVYFEQVNVPKTILMTAAEALGKIKYSEFAEANVTLINEAVKAFQAFSDSIVKAEWPSADDVKKDSENTSESPKTGNGTYLGVAVFATVALTAAATVILKKKED